MYIIDLKKILTYSEILEYSIRLTKRYEPLLKLESIGKSVLGKELFALSLGYGKKYLICLAGIHGRESINPAVFLEIVEDYCKAAWGENKYYGMNMKELLREYSIYFIPLCNPDGYIKATGGKSYFKKNANNIDLNRNFQSESFVPDRYMLSPNSEPEVKALVKVFTTLPSIGLLDFHSRGKGIYYYRNAMSQEYNERQYRIAKALAEVTGYSLYKPEEEHNSLTDKINHFGGNSVHFYSEKIKQPAFTIETVPENARFPLDYHYIKVTYEEIRRVPAYYLQMLKDSIDFKK